MTDSLNNMVAESPETKSENLSEEEYCPKFDEVLFMNVRDSYPLKEDITLRYVVLGAVKQTKWDWIGLFRVGWVKAKDFITYQYVEQQVGNELLQVTFPSESLSKDEEEFYVFAYVTGSSCVKGVSIPFQITKTNLNEKLVEIDHDDDNGFCVLELESKVLKDQIMSKDEEIKTLTCSVEKLTLNEEMMKEKISQLEEKFNAANIDMMQKHEEEIREKNEKILKLETEQNNTNQKFESKCSKLEDENRTIKSKCSKLEDENRTIKSKCSVLEDENRTIKSKCSKLEDELDAINKQLQDAMINQAKELDAIRSSHLKFQKLKGDLELEVQSLQKCAKSAKSKSANLQVELTRKKNDIGMLKNQNEKLRDTSCELKSYIDDLYNYVDQMEPGDSPDEDEELFADLHLSPPKSTSGQSWESEPEYWKSRCTELKDKYAKLNQQHLRCNNKMVEAFDRIKACRKEYLSLHCEYQKLANNSGKVDGVEGKNLPIDQQHNPFRMLKSPGIVHNKTSAVSTNPAAKVKRTTAANRDTSTTSVFWNSPKLQLKKRSSGQAVVNKQPVGNPPDLQMQFTTE